MNFNRKFIGLFILSFCASLCFAQAPELAEGSVWQAIVEGDIRTLRKLKKEGIDLTQREPNTGTSPLVMAAGANQPKSVAWLLKNDVDPNSANFDGNTALHAAAFLGYDKVARTLIKGGADVLRPNGEGSPPSSGLETDWQTTQYVAQLLGIELSEDEVNAGRIKVGELIEANLIKRARDDVWIAVMIGDGKAMRRHIRRMDDLDVLESESGATVLTVAALFGHEEIVIALLDAGADVNKLNRDGSTALLAAALMGRAEIVKSLLAHGADRSIVSNDGSTALTVAELDWSTTEYFANALSVPFDYNAVTAGKKETIALLKAD